MIKGCDPLYEVLDIFDHPRVAYFVDGFDFIRVGLHPLVRDHETKEFPKNYPKGILNRVQLYLVFP